MKPHKRKNRKSSGYHSVRAHVRRLETVKEEELCNIRDFYLLSCPECGNQDIEISVTDKVILECGLCSKQWSGPKELTEETGPRIAELLTINKNEGVWKVRWDVLSSRTENVFSALSSASKAKRTSKKSKTLRDIITEENPLCPICGSPMRLKTPKPGQQWKAFWGCSRYYTEGCRGTREFK